ncbi:MULTISPECIES: hypothetical protein [Sulfurimonas]|uniref:hypothetical protein n=1 Tax=Sulfurimonas TaxID=202746 RepID=UPI0012647F45|nr:hypothetical protein [Sulfurimonas indica]
MTKIDTLKNILQKRFDKVEKHYIALSEYKTLIDEMQENNNIYEPFIFNTLNPQQRAILDAYLKRFASLQDFLGAKIFPLLLEVAGVHTSKMSEVLSLIEKEEIIDSIENWIELREVRNELEHDYPQELKDALDDLRYCIENFTRLENYYKKSLDFYGCYR